MITRYVALSAAGAMLLGFAGPAVADDKEVTLAVAHTAGKSVRMKIEVAFSAGGMEGTLAQVSKTTVKEIRKNGDVVLVGESEPGKITIGGMEQDMPAEPGTTEVRTKLGKLVELTAPESEGSPFTPEAQRLMADLSEALLPDKPVKVDGTWQTELDNPMVKGKKVVVKGTYIGLEKVVGLDCWKIKQTSTAATDDQGAKATFSTIFWLDPSNGQTVKSQSELSDFPTQYGAMSMTYKVSLAKPTAEAKPTPEAPPAAEVKPAG